MNITFEKYGADADDNRGVIMITYEIEESDREEIMRQVAEIIADYDEDDRPNTVSVFLSDDYGEYKEEFEVNVKDYL